MLPEDQEDKLLRSAALQTAKTILLARQKAERDLVQANLALQASQRELALIYSNVSDVIFYLAVEPGQVYRFLSVNKAFLDTTGLSEAQVVGQTVQDVIPKASLDAVLGYYRSAISEKKTVRWEESSVYPSGKKVGAVSVTPIFDPAGNCINLIGTVHDVTERKRSEEVHARLAAVVESSDDAILTKTLDGIITTWNQGAQRMFGYDASETIGKPVLMLMPADRLDEEGPILDRLRRGLRIDHYETVRKRKDGSLFNVSLTVSPIKDADGNIIGASKIARDITERMRTQQALQDESAMLELLNKTGTAIASQLDLQNVVQTVTDTATELTGAKFGAFFYNVTNQQGESFLLYTLSGAPREAFEKFGLPRNTPVFNPTFRGEGVVRSDDITKDPRYGTMSPHHGMPKGHLPVRSYLAVPVISRSGEVIGGLFFGHPDAGIFGERTERLILGVAAQASVAIDNARLYETAQKEILERKRAEAALQQARDELSRHAEELEKQVAERTAHLNASLQSMEGVCYTLAHDLRAPLRAVQGFTKVILEDYAPAFDENGRQVAGRIVNSAARMDNLIRDLLDYARLSHAELPCRNIDLNDLIHKVIDDLAPGVNASHAQIKVQPLPPVQGNQTVLEQVFTNLFTNSFKFVQKGAFPTIMIRAETNSQNVRIFFKDNGIGIKPEYHDRVFGIFQRLHNDNAQYAGTGVGLAIVKKGVERMNGRVAIDPGVSEGTCFILDLPKAA